MEVLIYHLKFEDNIKRFAQFCKELNINLSIIARPSNIDYDKILKNYNFKIYHSFEEYLKRNRDKKFLFFETYGNKYIWDVNLKKFDIFVFGSEDYGIPLYEIDKVKNKEIVKIPTKLNGSYNVVSTFVIFLSFYYSQ